MKNLTLLLLSLTLLAVSCAPSATNDVEEVGSTEVLPFPERAQAMNIYEVNIRQYTPEGTISAFTEHLPRLQALGVDILWIMPVQPVGLKNRKGPLGSYYSIQDYGKVNPNFGTIEDFKALVADAHSRGMLVVLDWVANHTSFDHPWTEREGYHTLDSAGNITWPEGTDWTDVADLNYDTPGVGEDMIQEMKWWVQETDIDGFRCDMAGMVPMDFWNAAKDTLDTIKDLFMLAEWDEPKVHNDAFHMTYAWGLHHGMSHTVKGELNADSLEAMVQKDIERYGDDAFRMMFTTNHDENSWNGTVFERLGDGHRAFAAWAFTVRGMPMIYSGQEAGLDKRLRFFEKDTIDFSNTAHVDFYTKLLEIKHNNPALYNGAYGGELVFLADGNPHVSSFSRTKDENVVTTIVNLSDESQSIDLSAEGLGEMVDVFSSRRVELGGSVTLEPYEFLVDIKQGK